MIATALEAIRTRRKLSRAHLAAKANVSAQQIRLYESPRIYGGAARVNTMKAIAEALGVKVSTLFDSEGRAKDAKEAR
jgi:transcriptional regulator with XRE-family HTH domain